MNIKQFPAMNLYRVLFTACVCSRVILDMGCLLETIPYSAI